MCIYLCLSIYTDFTSTIVWCWWKLIVDEDKLFLYVFDNVFFFFENYLLFVMHFVFHILLGIIFILFFLFLIKLLVGGFSMHWICQKLLCCCHAYPKTVLFGPLFAPQTSGRNVTSKMLTFTKTKRTNIYTRTIKEQIKH